MPYKKHLLDDLLSNYNRLIRPVQNHSENLTVWIGLKLTQLTEMVFVLRTTCLVKSRLAMAKCNCAVNTSKSFVCSFRISKVKWWPPAFGWSRSGSTAIWNGTPTITAAWRCCTCRRITFGCRTSFCSTSKPFDVRRRMPKRMIKKKKLKNNNTKTK